MRTMTNFTKSEFLDLFELVEDKLNEKQPARDHYESLNNTH